MRHIFNFLLIFLTFCLPTFASAATAYLIHAEWASYASPSGYTVTGFNLYREGTRVCQNQNPAATAMDCTVSLDTNTSIFTLTARFSNGTESPHSSPFSFTIPSSPPTGSPQDDSTYGSTSIRAEWIKYTSPNGYTLSGFNLYQEGMRVCQNQNPAATAMDCTVSLNTNTSNFTLTARFSNGTESPHSSPFTLSLPSAPPSTAPPPASTLPTAVIATSTAAGQAPLTVNFSGTGSKAGTNAYITSYSWNFGNGFSANGANTSYTFTSAGTFNTTLTVTDSKGLTSSATTPIVVTAATASTNKAPTAIATASPTSGSAPLKVTFDGSASTDEDGSIVSYVWYFGDGSSATGKTATHTYTTESTFNATLRVTDNQGASSTASTTIKVQPDLHAAALNIEVGEVLVTHRWVRVPFTTAFEKPIVVAGPPQFNNSEPCVVRIRNVDKTGFDIRLTEWDYLNGWHPEETVSYLVLEEGRSSLPNGSIVEAGSFTGSTSFRTVKFNGSFANAPVIMTTIASFNEADAISGRIKDVGTTGFDYYFREQESNENIHANETIHFIAWEPGTGTIGSIQYQIATTAKAVNHSWYGVTFAQPFKQVPFLLADMQTTSSHDTSALRTQQVTVNGFQIMVEEEQSADSETFHPTEQVGYLLFSPTGSK
jgi:PKD repeat protein